MGTRDKAERKGEAETVQIITATSREKPLHCSPIEDRVARVGFFSFFFFSPARGNPPPPPTPPDGSEV